MMMFISLFVSPMVGYLLLTYKKKLCLKDEITIYALCVWFVNFISMGIVYLEGSDNQHLINFNYSSFFVKYNLLSCLISIVATLSIYFIITQFEIDIKIISEQRKKKIVSKK